MINNRFSSSGEDQEEKPLHQEPKGPNPIEKFKKGGGPPKPGPIDYSKFEEVDEEILEHEEQEGE